MFKVRGCVSSRGLFYRPNGISNGMECLGAFDVRGSYLENCAEKGALPGSGAKITA